MLTDRGVQPRNPRLASVPDHQLCIGHLSTIVRSPGDHAFGVVYSLTHDEIRELYRDSGLDVYGPEAVIAELFDGPSIPAVCWILREPPSPDEQNPDLVEKLGRAMAEAGLPAIDLSRHTAAAVMGVTAPC
ncbi:hypothetical protein [Spectribacter hydrogenoxidans]|uniref:AIG2-like family protein n=1 Tax=Spectribacter hydrogenoxidans TaxID=3075608 RepID=A0ABU3C3D7_9GAMM|nr:hypothetical protein [Salinisphaera sp. W335]MDT0635901.1 hypothetical protein [Salinisphaera sp. W335]